MNPEYEQNIVIDLEFTRPTDEAVKPVLPFEIIQIGAVCVGLHGNRLDAFEGYVQTKPRFACELSRDAKRASKARVVVACGAKGSGAYACAALLRVQTLNSRL